MTTLSFATVPPLAHQVFVARQPIFDSQNRRVAYELLYRANQEATGAGVVSGDTMCSDTALHSVVSIGLDRLTAGATAFVNITRDHLLSELHKLFDPTTVVLELLESIDGDPEVVEACKRAVADGYSLALDDYDGRESLDVLLPLAKIIKLDVLDRDLASMGPLVKKLLGLGLVVLAERVESGEVHAECQKMGFSLFQGFVFSRPETLDGRSMSVEQGTMFNIISLLRDPEVEDFALVDAFRSDPSLSFGLLRVVNSASFGSRAVESIDHAIRLTGREVLSRWMMVMLVASVGRRDPVAGEAVAQALVRGRFCELYTITTGSGDPSTRFLVGLLSRMDVLLGMPIAQVLERLPVSAQMRDALLSGTGPHAPVLSLAVAYESADWTKVDANTLDTLSTLPVLAEIYGDAVAWAVERLSSTNT